MGSLQGGGGGAGREKAGGAGGAAGGASGDLAVVQDRRFGTTTVVSTVVDTNTKKRMRLTEVRPHTPCLNCYRLLWGCRLVSVVFGCCLRHVALCYDRLATCSSSSFFCVRVCMNNCD